jgi:hypothetical protein
VVTHVTPRAGSTGTHDESQSSTQRKRLMCHVRIVSFAKGPPDRPGLDAQPMG